MILRDYQLALVDRIRDRYVAGDRAVLAVLPTGAGKTPAVAEIGRLCSARGNRVLFVAHTTELVSQAVAKFAAFGIAAEVEQAGRHAHDAPVVVASIQTLRGDRLASWPADAFALVIHDEAHRTAAATSEAIVHRFATAKLLGVTATPARSDNRPLGDTYQSLVVGATIRELTDQGYLVPARVFAPTAELRAGQTAMTPAAAYAQHGAGRPAVVFCMDVDHAHSVAAAMPVPTGVVHGDMPAALRKETLERFATGDLRALSCVSVLVEGWDEPSTAVCILARAFGHVGSYLQAIGRVLRPSTGKDHATVIDLCGSALKHGTPDTERVYSLDGKPIRKSDRLPIKQCATCGAVFVEARLSCPHCGVELPVRHRATPQSTDVGVAELGPGRPARPMRPIVLASKYPGICRSCRGRIAIGDRIAWSQGQKPEHEMCWLTAAMGAA